MASPTINVIGLSLRFQWAESHLTVVLDHFRESRGQIHAEFLATTTAPGYAPHLLGPVQLNLMSGSVRKILANQLAERYKEANWLQLLEVVCLHGVRHHRQGEPVLLLTGQSDVPAPSFLLEPLVYNRLPTVLYGPGGISKSYLALLGAMLVQSGTRLGNLSGTQSETLYLDYESDEGDVVLRLKRIGQAHPDLANVQIAYRRCHVPIADDVADLSKHIGERDVKLLIIDSLAAACGSELERAETATRFFAALRCLRVGTLILAHVPKNSETKTIYGSVFFENYARSAWEMKKVQETGERITRLGLYHRKANLSGYLPAIGLRVVFEPDATRFESLDLLDEPDLAEPFSLRVRLQNALKTGRKTAQELADETGEKVATVRSRLNEGRGTYFVKLDDNTWGLACTPTVRVHAAV